MGIYNVTCAMNVMVQAGEEGSGNNMGWAGEEGMI